MSGTLGDYIVNLRTQMGITQTELSRRSGIERTTVNRIETGTTKLPSAAVRRALADALGVRHIDLLIAAGEITAKEADVHNDTRSHARQRLMQLIDQIPEDSLAFLLLEQHVRQDLKLEQQIRSGEIPISLEVDDGRTVN